MVTKKLSTIQWPRSNFALGVEKSSWVILVTPKVYTQPWDDFFFILLYSLNPGLLSPGNLLVQISSQSPSPLSPPIDPEAPMTTLGLDSMTLIQIKAVIEKRFYCNIPDEFLFSHLASLNGFVEAIKIGELSPTQKNELESAGRDMQVDAADGRTVPVVRRKEPLCPWWTCCY